MFVNSFFLFPESNHDCNHDYIEYDNKKSYSYSSAFNSRVIVLVNVDSTKRWMTHQSPSIWLCLCVSIELRIHTRTLQAVLAKPA